MNRFDEGRMPRFEKRDWLFVAACVALALIVRWIFFRGIHSFDDFNYLRHAAEVWKGRFDLAGVEYWHGQRFLIFVPIAGVFAMFGVSETTAVLWPLLVSLATVAMIYRIGFDAHSRTAAIAGGVAAAFLPMFVNESTRVLPGPIINGLMVAAVLCFIHAECAAKRPGVWLFFSGAFFAYMPWSGHLGLAFGFFFPLALLFRRRPLLSYWPLALGLVGIVFIASFHQWAAAKDPLANLAVSSSVLANEVATPKPLFYFWLMVKPLLSHGGVLYLALIGAWAALFRRRRYAGLFLAWMVVTYLAVEFGSSSLTEYRPLFKQARYLTVLAVPGVVLAAIGIGEAWHAARGRAVHVALLVVGALTLVGAMETLRRSTAWSTTPRTELAAIERLVTERRGQPIYVVHWLWNTRVGFFMGYEDDYFPTGYTPYNAVKVATADPGSKNRYVQTLRPGQSLEPGLMLLDEVLLDHTIGPRRIPLVGEGEIPRALLEPPPEWRLLGRHASLAIYEVPPGTTWFARPDSVGRLPG